MRILLIGCGFISGMATIAAAPVPVPAVDSTMATKFDRLWDDAGRTYPDVIRLNCYLETLTPKQRFQLLNGKMQPVELPTKLAKSWLHDLGSNDEQVWKAAEENLKKRNIRLAMDIPEALDEAETDVARRRLAKILDMVPDEKFGPLGNYTLSFQIRAGNGNLNWNARNDLPDAAFPKGRCNFGWGYPLAIGTVNLEYDRWSYSRKALATAIDYLTREYPVQSTAALERLASGHTGVGPTIDAKRALALPKWKAINLLGYLVPFQSPETDLAKLWPKESDALLNPAVTRAVLADHKSALAFVKTKVKPQSMEKDDALKLLKDFLGDDESKAQTAFDEFQIRDFRLAIPLTEAWELAKTPRDRCRLVGYDKSWGEKKIAGVDQQFLRRDFRLAPPDPGSDYWIAQEFLRPGVEPIPNENFGGYQVFDGLKGRYWDYTREKIALAWLEAINSPEAWEWIRAISKGNPEVVLTLSARQLIEKSKK